MHKPFLTIAGILGALTVAAGAFGAHGLRGIVGPEILQIYETAVKYQFFHVFALLASGILFQSFPNRKILWSGRLFLVGMLLFCGSLYGLTYLEATGNQSMNWVGFLTPVGGLCFISGWILIALGVRDPGKSV
jgi:uncharacterized membrane protein YgdD (TMEM256/DUF423 family)